jgi:hypothetical protein
VRLVLASFIFPVRRGGVRCGTGMVVFGTVRFGSVGHGKVQLGRVIK